jgi:predicted Zn-dependent protease
MKNIFLISVFSFLGFSALAQNDSVAEILNPNGFSKTELEQEKKELKFQEAFIESLQEKTIKNYDKALESLAICESVFPDNVAMLFEFAKNYFAIKEYTDAHNYCDKALSFESDNFWILKLSANIFVKEHNYPEAIRLQKVLYSMKPSEAGDLLRLYYMARKKKEAVILIEEIDKNSTYVVAIDFYKKFYKLTPSSNNTSSPQQVEGITLRKAFKKNATYSKLLVLLESDLKQKDFQALLIDSSEGLELFPAQAVVYLYNGLAHNALSNPQKAIEPLVEGLDYIVDNPALKKQFYRALIAAYSSLNNQKKSNFYQKLITE